MSSEPACTPAGRISRAIVVQVVVVSCVALVQLVLAVAGIVEGRLGVGWAVGGALGGLAVGLVASRMKRMEWNERAGQVVSRIDWLGGVILVCFVAAQVWRNGVLGHWAEGVGLTTLGLCVSAGTLAGQAIGTRRAVRAVLPDARPS
jgi:hypothetical protein